MPSLSYNLMGFFATTSDEQVGITALFMRELAKGRNVNTVHPIKTLRPQLSFSLTYNVLERRDQNTQKHYCPDTYRLHCTPACDLKKANGK